MIKEILLRILLGKIYVGIRNKHRIVFRAYFHPTWHTHGHLYTLVIGPFETMAGAVYLRDHGENNPHIQHVDDAERLAHEST